VHAWGIAIARAWTRGSARAALNAAPAAPVVLFIALFAPALARPAVAQNGSSQAPADIRAILEGTWHLVEWHVDGTVMRPPEMTGRWMVHDGVVMAIRHRDGPKSFESTAAWGEYRITATEWIYGYERSEDSTGPTAAESKMRVRITKPVPMLEWTIRREGGKLFLERPKSIRWEFDGPWFTLYGADGKVLRKYQKVSN